MWILWQKLWPEGSFVKPCKSSTWKCQSVQLWFMWQQLWEKSRFQSACKNSSWKTKPFECDSCYKVFSFKGSFERHVMWAQLLMEVWNLSTVNLVWKHLVQREKWIVHENQKESFFHKGLLNTHIRTVHEKIEAMSVWFLWQIFSQEKKPLEAQSFNPYQCMKKSLITNVNFVKSVL